MTAAPVRGSVDAAFSPVREAFAANFAERGEPGAGLCVRLGGRAVVDLYGGHADAEGCRPWRADTLVNAYSVGKGVISALVLLALERGRLSLDRPVVELWPEFAAENKQGITLRMLLAHRAGLPAVRERLPDDAMYHWDAICAALAATRPWWTPDTAHGYHVNLFGFLVGECLRRATGRGVGELLREWMTGPLAAEFHFGVPAALHERVATLRMREVAEIRPEYLETAFPRSGDPELDTMRRNAYFNPPGLSGVGVVNTAAWRSSVIPSTSGHGTARGVAALYAALVDGGTALGGLSRELTEEARRVHSDGDDLTLGRPSRFGLGFQVSSPERPLGAPDGHGFGHYGYGGSLGFADPEADLAFGYLTCRPGNRWQEPRVTELVDAVYRCL